MLDPAGKQRIYFAVDTISTCTARMEDHQIDPAIASSVRCMLASRHISFLPTFYDNTQC